MINGKIMQSNTQLYKMRKDQIFGIITENLLNLKIY